MLFPGYAPIRFTGTSGVQLSLEYGFFAELQSSTLNTDTSDERNSRKKRDVDIRDDVKQIIEVKFRALDVQNSIILSSQTSSSRHSIEVSHCKTSMHGEGDDRIYFVIL